MTPEEELDHLRYMLRHILYCATGVPDGELIAMVRYIRDKRYEVETRLRELEARLREEGK